MSEELKPCPFCGNPVITNSEHRPLCQYCAYLFRVDFWNTRPIEDALRAENDRLTAEVGFLQAHRNQLQVHNKNIVEKIQSLLVDNIKLEQDVAHYSEETEYLKNENDRLTAEVARLKAALEKYANDDNWDDRGGWVNCFFAYGNCEGMDVARAALAERRHK